MQRKVLHQFVMMAKRQMPSRIGDHIDAEDKAAQEGRDYYNYYSWWLLWSFFFLVSVVFKTDHDHDIDLHATNSKVPSTKHKCQLKYLTYDQR